MFLLFPLFNPTKGDFNLYKNVNFNADQVFGSVCWKCDFVCLLHLEKIEDEKNSQLEKGGIRIRDDTIFEIPLQFNKCS